MNRPRIKIMTLAAALAVSFWLADAWTDTFFFAQESFSELLLHPPPHKLFLRSLLSACILFFGAFAVAIAGRLQQAEATARKTENRLRTTLDSIGEAVIATDTQGIIRRMNHKGEELTGWSHGQARGRHINEVLRLFDARTKRPCSDPAQKVLAEGAIQGLANHTLLISREGKEYHIADSASPIRDDHGDMTGVVLVLRDMSEEYTAGLLTRKRLELVDLDDSYSREQTVTRALDEITDLVNSPMGFFHVLNEEGTGLAQQYWSSSTLRELCRIRDESGHRNPERAGVWAECLREKRPVIHNDYQALPRAKGTPTGHPRMVRELVVPVLRDNRVVAVLGTGNKASDYTERDQEITTFLADVTWDVLQSRQAEEKVYHLYRVLNALRKVNQLITSEKERNQLIREACLRLTETRGYHCAWIVLFDAGGGISASAEAGLSEEFPLFLHGLRNNARFFCVRNALRQPDILAVHDPATSCSDCPLAAKHSTWATLSIRLEHEGTVHGMLAVSMDRSFAQYAEEWNLFREIAADLAFALYSLELEEERSKALESLRESERKLSTLMANLPGMAYRCRTNPECTMEFISQGCLELTGYKNTDFVGNQKMAYADIISERDREQVQRIIQDAIREKKHFEAEYGITTAAGEERRVWHKGICVADEDNELGLEGFITDITDKKRAEEALQRQEENLRAILEANPDPLIVYDHLGHPRYINPAFTMVFGWTFEELQGRCVPFVPEDEAEKTRAGVQDIYRTGNPVQFDTRRLTKDNRILEIRVSAALITRAGRESDGLVVNLTDITERKRMEKKLEEMSLYDPLTGLYNRALFEEEMRRLGNKRWSSAAIVVCDIDGLKLINDTLGHSKGDDLLRAAADILRSCFRSGDLAARIGGDEFAVLLYNTEEEIVQIRCEQIRSEVARYHKLDPELGLSVSVGYAVTREPDRPEDMNVLFKRADDAMYRHKLQQKSTSRNETVQALITTMEARDHVTDGHAARLANYARKLGRSLGLSGDQLKDLRLLARFHDLGKVGVPDSILFKSAPLSEEEFEDMKRHCEIGHRIALSTTDLAPIAEFILKHHEWWDGRGYPLGLSGEEIPLECRILAVVDAYDAMTSDRSYKKAMSHRSAVEELQRCAGTQFDPDLVEAFIRIVKAPKGNGTGMAD